jgi:hypothetical protein
LSNRIQPLLHNLSAAHAEAIHNDLLPLALRPDEPCDELVRDIEEAVNRHAERMSARLPY